MSKMKHNGNAVIFIIIIMSLITLLGFSLRVKTIQDTRYEKISLEYTTESIKIESFQKEVMDKKVDSVIQYAFEKYLDNISKKMSETLKENPDIPLENIDISNIDIIQFDERKIILDELSHSPEDDFETYVEKRIIKNTKDGAEFSLQIYKKNPLIMAESNYILYKPDFTSEDLKKIYNGERESIWKDEFLKKNFHFK